jgi:periplasmic copper chaperone A
MRRRLFSAALAAAGILAGTASAHEFKVGNLTIGHPYALETPATAKTGAGYFSITNNGTMPDRLIAIRSAFPRTQIHATEIDAQGVARMTEVDGLEIAPGVTVTLQPGGLHVMFMGLQAPLVVKETIPATLVFESAGEVGVEFNVQPRDDAADTMGDMPGMSH